MQEPIGRIMSGNTTSFTCGVRSASYELGGFGTFVKVTDKNEIITIVGIVYSMEIQDDPLVRQMIMASQLTAATVRDQRENRLIPIEMRILNVGYFQADKAFYNLPPRPPISFDPVYTCTPAEILKFTQKLDFLPVILKTNGLPNEELLAAAINTAASVQPDSQRYSYLVNAGRRVLQMLKNDLDRCDRVLRLITPNK